MNMTDFNPDFESIVARALQYPVMERQGYTLEFARFSTTLYLFRPDIPFCRHPEIYRRACAHQVLALAEQKCPRWAARLRDISVPVRLRRRPGIIATFHTGSYRLLPRWLHTQGIPFSLVISNEVMLAQGGRYREQAANPPADVFDLIDADRPDAFFRMRRALASGKCLLIYVDGNSGAATASASREQTLAFFGRHIRVKTGTAMLACLTGVPIYPIAHIRHKNGTSPFDIGRTIIADKAAPRGRQAMDITRKLYQRLEGTLREDPAQWENWFFLHRFMADEERIDKVSSSLDDPAWIVVETGGRIYHLDRKTGTCVPALVT